MAQRLLINLDQLDIVKKMPLFTGLKEEEKDNFLKGGGIYTYPDKKYLFRQEDPVNFVYIVCRGLVQELRETEDGHGITVNFYKAGDIFCKVGTFLEDGLHRTNAVTVGETHIMELPIKEFKQNLKKYESVASRLLSSLAQYVVTKQIEAEQRATMTSPEILALFLRQTCASHGFDPRGFTLPYKKSLIASRLGMEIETLSRALPKLKEHGIVVKGRHVIFTDKQEAGGNVVKFFPAPRNNIRQRACA
jgi:CRP-like cAMP-binding protein